MEPHVLGKSYDTPPHIPDAPDPHSGRASVHKLALIYTNIFTYSSPSPIHIS